MCLIQILFGLYSILPLIGMNNFHELLANDMADLCHYFLYTYSIYIILHAFQKAEETAYV